MEKLEQKPIIELRSITKRYGEKTIIDGLDLTINDGEFLTILGPSGCGKTTVLRLIAGFEELTDGAIILDGQDVSDIPAEQRPVNTVFQSYALLPHYNIFDNVAYGLKLRKMDKNVIKKKVTDILALVGLEGMENRMTNQLSGGQQQRVAIARAVSTNPTILLADEPTGALDQKTGAAVMDLFHSLNEEGRTIIMITHDRKIAGHARRIVKILDGVISEGDVEDA